MGRLAISPFSLWVDRMAMSMPAISLAMSASDILDMIFLVVQVWTSELRLSGAAGRAVDRFVELHPSDGRILDAPMSEAALMRASFANLAIVANASSLELRMTTRVSQPASPAILVLFMASGRAALGTAAFLDLFDDLTAEGFEAAWIARRDDALIDNDL